MLNIFDWIRGHSADGRTATELYGSIVTQARQAVFFTHFGVADVAEKRYELIVLHIVLVLERLRASGDRGMAIAQALIETFVRDLDGSIREMAVGDTKVPAKVKKAAGGLLDRDVLYRQAFEESGRDSADGMTTAALLNELIFDGTECRGSAATLRYALAARAQLESWTLADGVEKLAFPKPDRFIAEAI